MNFRETKLFKDNVGLFREKRGGAEMVSSRIYSVLCFWDFSYSMLMIHTVSRFIHNTMNTSLDYEWSQSCRRLLERATLTIVE